MSEEVKVALICCAPGLLMLSIFWSMNFFQWRKKKARLRAIAEEERLDQAWWDNIRDGDILISKDKGRYRVCVEPNGKRIKQYYWISPGHRAYFTHVQEHVPW